MGQTPDEVQIIVEDFSEEFQEDAAKIASPFNGYISQLQSILDNNASIQAEFKTFSITGNETLTYASTLTQPFGAILSSWRNTSSGAELTAMPGTQVSFDGAGNTTLRFLGFNAGDDYSVNVIVYTGT